MQKNFTGKDKLRTVLPSGEKIAQFPEYWSFFLQIY